jgi:hypothetical protein
MKYRPNLHTSAGSGRNPKLTGFDADKGRAGTPKSMRGKVKDSASVLQ